MAYDFGRQVLTMLTTAGVPVLNCNATAATRRFRYVAHNDVVVQAVGLISLTTKASAPKLSFRVTATAGIASVSGDQFATITLTTAHVGAVKGKQVIRKALNTTVSAGSEVVGQVITAASNNIVGAFLYVQNKPYDWANNSTVSLVTA